MLFDIEHPIIQAPMGGGPSTPALVAAVSNAGGLGSLAGAYLKPEQIAETIHETRALTSRPFAVNLFAGGYDHSVPAGAERMLDLLAEVHRELGLPAPELPVIPANPFQDQLDAVLEAQPAVFSFTFGIPHREAMDRLGKRGIAVVGTATTAEEAKLLSEAHIDAIIAQGAEAGAHRGTFAGSFENSMTPIRALTRAIAQSTKLPVIASGGIMDGRAIGELVSLGASAAQLGTAFLACPESGASATYKKAILNASGDPTVITRAYSGRPARGIENAFVKLLEGKKEWILPYPVQNALTRSMRTAAARLGRAEYLSLWAGTGVAQARSLPAARLVALLVEEMAW